MAIAYLALGSNINPEENLRAALIFLKEQTRLLTYSSVYITPPQGYADQPDFYNMAAKVETHLEAWPFKRDVIGAIEQTLKRIRDPNNKNAPRTIDIDIALWDDAVFDYGLKPWHVPEPDILRFAHVAVPLAEIAPDYVHPEMGQTLAEIAAIFSSDNFNVTRLDLSYG